MNLCLILIPLFAIPSIAAETKVAAAEIYEKCGYREGRRLGESTLCFERYARDIKSAKLNEDILNCRKANVVRFNQHTASLRSLRDLQPRSEALVGADRELDECVGDVFRNHVKPGWAPKIETATRK